MRNSNHICNLLSTGTETVMLTILICWPQTGYSGKLFLIYNFLHTIHWLF